jgi:Family of unknown function (DUF6055)
MSYPFRRLAAGTIAGLALSVLASTPAFASSRPDTSSWPSPLTTTHFMVHRASDVSADDAQKVADDFEAAYATEVGSWGFNAPVADDDGLIDVYVTEPYVGGQVGEALRDDDTAPTGSGFAVLSPDATDTASTAAHELFHLIQYSMFTGGAKFLKEGTAEWAAANVTGKTSWLTYYWSDSAQPFDCTGQCGTYSYSRWIFFEYLSERYGTSIVKEIYQQVGAMQADTASRDLDAIDAVLSAHGSSLAQTFSDFSSANAAGAYRFPGLASSTKSLQPAHGVLTGVTSIGQVQSWTVDHLTASYVPIVSGDGRSKVANCGAATLHLEVTIPADVQSQPSFHDSTGTHALTINGNRASADVPWTNCDGTQGTLVLPNGSRTVDGAQFIVRITLDVIPPKAALGTAAPNIQLMKMPLRATIARKSPYLAFRVKSSGAGTLGVLLKAHYIRGNFRLHAGVNKLKLRLPRSFAGGTHQIVFTVYSTTGGRGQTIKRHVTISFSS